MSKDLHISVLIDFYGELLTEKQRQALDFYYNEDLSLFEIAQHMNISRQGVRDFIKRGEKQLVDMENALGLAGRFAKLSTRINEMDNVIRRLSEIPLPDAAADEVLRLRKISDDIKENL